MDHSAHTYMDQMHEGHDHHHHMDHHNHADHQNHMNNGQMEDQHVFHVDNGQTHDHHALHHIHGHQGHQAFFNSGLNATVLFENWVLDTKGSVFLACLCTFVLAIGYQGTKWFRQYLHVHYSGKMHSIKSKEHLVQTVLYITEFLVSYLLMLIVMTYNVWVFVVTVLGIALGYFLLAWHKEFKPVPVCASTDCEIVVNHKKLDPNSSEQELMPLGKQTATCNGCDIESIDELDEEDTPIKI